MPNLLNSYGRTTACVDNSGYVVLNLSGAQKFEEDTVFYPGKYKIEIAPGCSGYNRSASTVIRTISNMEHEEIITEPFIVRAYCGSNGNYSTQTAGTNPYSGLFKVNGIDARTINRNNYPHGIDVTHIFGAGGGNHRYYNSTSGTGPGISYGGGPNCLGDGNYTVYHDYGAGTGNVWGGAGSCLHLLPVGGVFGADYIRAYHVAPAASYNGSAYGGGDGQRDDYTSIGAFHSRGGNSPYGNGSADYYDSGTGTMVYPETGIGGGNKIVTINGVQYMGTAGAYFNGTQWIDEPGRAIDNGTNSSYIRIIYIGTLE